MQSLFNATKKSTFCFAIFYVFIGRGMLLIFACFCLIYYSNCTARKKCLKQNSPIFTRQLTFINKQKMCYVTKNLTFLSNWCTNSLINYPLIKQSKIPLIKSCVFWCNTLMKNFSRIAQNLRVLSITFVRMSQTPIGNEWVKIKR